MRASGEVPGWESLLPGLWRAWPDAAGESGYALAVDDDAVVLIDPLGVAPLVATRLGRVEAMILTAPPQGTHDPVMRALAGLLGCASYVPTERPNPAAREHAYGGGDLLPAGLVAIHAPSSDPASCALWRAHAPALLFAGTLLSGDERGRSAHWPPTMMESNALVRARASLSRLLEDLPFEVVCFARGRPLLRGARDRLRMAGLLAHAPGGAVPG